MNEDFFPLCVVTAVPTKDGIKFLHPRAQYEISDYVDLLWEILAEANGRQNLKSICRKIARTQKVDEELVATIVTELQSLEVVVDSREAYLHFHRLSSNPMPYSHNLTFDQVDAYTRSPRKPVVQGEAIDLTVDGPTALAALQTARKSCRSFGEDGIAMGDLSSILHACYTPNGPSTPSAGGLFPLKVYLIALTNNPLPRGYYELDTETKRLVRYSDKVDIEELEYCFNSDTLLYGASIILVIAADLGRHTGKYSARGYRYTLIEAGHVAQNIQLAAAEQQVGCLEYGGFLDEPLATEMGLTEQSISPLISIALGSIASTSEPDATDILRFLEENLVGTGKPVRYVRISKGNQPTAGESFFAATALHKPSTQQEAARSYRHRFVGGTASSASLAQVKAIAEAYERYASGLVRVDIQARASDIAKRWIDPRVVAPLTDDQLSLVPFVERFDERTPWEWVEGVAPRDRSQVYLPVDLVFYPLSTDALGRKLCHEGTSSGVAAYTTEAEATERAVLELMERDALMRTWFKRESPDIVGPNLIPVHWRKRVSYWEARGYEVVVLNLSRNGAVIVSVIIKSENNYPRFVSGASASLTSFEAALAKAFHEAELVLLHMLSSPPSKQISPERVVHPMDHARLYARGEHHGNLEWLWRGTELETVPEITTTRSELFDKLNPVVVQLSPPGSPLCVVRAVCEELVPINFGYGTEYYTHKTLQGQVHPESLQLPHFFA